MRANPEAQRGLHVAAEALALAVVAPGLVIVAATGTGLSARARGFLYAVAAGTALVDGYLLAKWLEKD